MLRSRWEPAVSDRLVIALGCVLLAATLGGCLRERPRSAAAASLTRISIADLEQWRSGRHWASHEELLQFFADNDLAFRQRGGVVVEQDTITQMAREMHTMFPLASCTRIEYIDGLLKISAPAQRVGVPGAYRQAFLALPDVLTLAVTPPAERDGCWYFRVRGERVRLEFSWFAKLVGPVYVHDFDVDRLEYHLDAATHRSSLAVHNLIRRDADRHLTVNGQLPADPEEVGAFLERMLLGHGVDPARAHQAPLSYREDYLFDLEARKLGRPRFFWDFDPPATAAR